MQVIPSHKFHGYPAVHGQGNQGVGYNASVLVPSGGSVTVSFSVIQGLYAPAAGNVILGRGDFQVRIVTQGPYCLYQSFAKSFLSHNYPPF